MRERGAAAAPVAVGQVCACGGSSAVVMYGDSGLESVPGVAAEASELSLGDGALAEAEPGFGNLVVDEA